MDLSFIASPMELPFTTNPMDLSFTASPMDLAYTTSPMDLSFIASPLTFLSNILVSLLRHVGGDKFVSQHVLLVDMRKRRC